MPLGTRELYLVLRARDEASRVLRGASSNINNLNRQQVLAAQSAMRHGTALATVGVGIAVAGAAGLQFFNNATNAAIEYQQEVGKTFTQVDKVGISMERLSEIGLQVAKDFPVPFESIQATFYDIFSSINVNAAQSETLLRAFAKAAVAGQSDMQVAGRATIAVLNAYQIPAEKVNEVNDVMFQLVRKGVGTYDEFAAVIGRAIPSSVRAGQSFENLAGMMAFLTRNGLSTAMAASSAARALDSLSHPASVKRLEEMGIAVKNAKGEFRPMAEVVQALSDKLKNMSNPERAKALQELFKGSGGTIQARRFWDIAIKQPDALKQYTSDMYAAKGATDAAYKTMAAAPLSQIQQMQNRYQALRIEIGQKLIPVKLQLIKILSEVISWWDNLSPRMQKIIVLVGAATAVFLLLIGIVAAAAGAFVMISAALTLLGTGFLTVAAYVAIAAVAIAAIGVVIYVIIKYHEQIWAWIQKVWKGFATFIQPVVDGIVGFAKVITATVLPALKSFWDNVTKGAKAAWDGMKKGFEAIADAWDYFMSKLNSGKMDWLIYIFQQIWTVIWGVAKLIGVTLAAAFGIIVDIIGGVLGPALTFIGEVFKALMNIIAGVVKFIVAVLSGDLKGAFKAVQQIVKGMGDAVAAAFKLLLTIIINTVKAIVNGVINFFKGLWNALVGHSIIPDMVKAIISWIAKLRDSFVAYVGSLVTKAVDWFKSLPGKTWDAIRGITTKLYDAGKQGFDKFNQAIMAGAKWVVDYVGKIPGRIVSAIGGVTRLLYYKGTDILNGLFDGLKAVWTNITGWVKGLGTWIKDHKGPISLDRKLLVPAGSAIMNGLWEGLKAGAGPIGQWLKQFTDDMGGGTLGHSGWQSQMAVLRKQFPGLQLISGYRPGAITATGNKSYHASGRAVDLPPRWDIFNWIKKNFGAKTKELIFSPAGAQQVWNGRNHYYGEPTRGDHWNHVHWAYKQGAWDTGAKKHLATIDPHEMIIPREPAESIRKGGMGGRTVNVYVTINTQEIDPIKHGADLGFEIARRMGS